jgi:hypothetical protein
MKRKPPNLSAISFVLSHAGAFSAPFLNVLLPKKREGNLGVYFRFLSTQKLTMPVMQAMVIAAIMVSYVGINGGFCSCWFIMFNPFF